ncbi:MAG: DUF1722 domain-containing protein [Candidatus Aminicenantes bacterium]|nr:DUF1722 domain-containing protein [Candidatus Aminicenantes bacterium]
MIVSAKPVVVISKCLEFDKCRYNGEIISSPEVARLKPLLNFITICPEMETGLSVPRHPVRIISHEKKHRLLQPDTGRDITSAMNAFLDTFFAKLQVVDGFILKEKSPSCGTRKTKIYPGPGKVPPLALGAGFFGSAALKRFPHLPIESEERLTDSSIKEHFLTRLFAVFRFRLLKQSPSFSRLEDFQARHKPLFMAYNREETLILEDIAANRKKKPLAEALAEYEPHFYKVFAKIPHTSKDLLSR